MTICREEYCMKFDITEDNNCIKFDNPSACQHYTARQSNNTKCHNDKCINHSSYWSLDFSNNCTKEFNVKDCIVYNKLQQEEQQCQRK